MEATGTAFPRIARPALARRIADAFEAGSVLLVAGAGYGKTMAVEEALELADRRAVWVACGEAGGEAGRLLTAAVDGLRAAVPGLADVVADRLATSVEPVDVRSATAALLADLEHLLVEPLVIVFDDAEEIQGAEAALALVDQLLNVRGAPLSLAIASRVSLPIKLAKLRAAGRLMEIGPAELSFTAGECEELLRLRHGGAVSEDEIEAAVAASEGWPMGVALTGLAGSGETAGALPRGDLFHYLAEEVLDRLEPAMRLAVVDSSVPGTLTPDLVEALGLPPGFLAEAQRMGLFLRAHPAGSFSYHPLFRSFLLEHLEDLRSDAERAELHAAVAAALEADGRHGAAIEHLVAAGRFEEALSALSVHGSELMRTSPGTVAAWLSRLPAELHGEPHYLLLAALLLWGAGQHEQARGPLRLAVEGYRDAGDIEQEWRARSFLADALTSVGEFDELADLADGWDELTNEGARLSAFAVAWYLVIALAGNGRIEEAEALTARLHELAGTTASFRYLDGVARVSFEPAAGRASKTLAHLYSTITQLERNDPLRDLPYALAMVVLVLRDLGEDEQAMSWLDRCELEAERVGLGFVARDCMLQRAFLLARSGEGAKAELELARAGQQRGTGWRGAHRQKAEAQLAAARGDSAEAVAAALRALDRASPGLMCYRVWTAVDMAPVLADNGASDVARSAVDVALADLDATFPAERGRMHRARLLASRACLEYGAGEARTAGDTLARCWEEAGAQAEQVVRVHWPRLRPVLWHALAEQVLTPEAVLPAIEAAFPAGEALMAMLDHPHAAVRQSALSTALAASHPEALARLSDLVKDANPQVAAAAAATRERLRSQPPPLRFELLGGFRARRAGWELDEAAWGRPMASRVVRFLLIQGAGVVPEDALFEAFWPDRTADSARQHLAQAVSRARKVLDLAGAETSVIEARERTYRLRLGERDSVDAVEFENAAASALGARHQERRMALERAAGLWTGEPLPEDRYAAWSFTWRKRLIDTYCQLLSALIERYESSGQHHDAIRAAQGLLGVDPLNERAHRQLMAAYARTGRTSYALRQYLECRRSLVVEMGVEPSAETSRLQARILAGEPV